MAISFVKKTPTGNAPNAEDEAINKEKEAATERMMNSMVERSAPVNNDNSEIKFRAVK